MFLFKKASPIEISFMDVLTIFVFVMWFWLLISIAKRPLPTPQQVGLGEAIWIIVLILIPYIGVFAYLIFSRKRHRGAECAAGPAGARRTFGAWLALVLRMKSEGWIS